MKQMIGAALLLLVVGRTAIAETANFDADVIGAAPKGWTITMTGRGESKWTVEEDATAPSQANVLRQSGEVEDATFKNAGRVGLWTKADSVTLFDDFTYGGKN